MYVPHEYSNLNLSTDENCMPVDHMWKYEIGMGIQDKVPVDNGEAQDMRAVFAYRYEYCTLYVCVDKFVDKCVDILTKGLIEGKSTYETQ